MEHLSSKKRLSMKILAVLMILSTTLLLFAPFFG